jgi:hypothetical protein
MPSPRTLNPVGNGRPCCRKSWRVWLRRVGPRPERSAPSRSPGSRRSPSSTFGSLLWNLHQTTYGCVKELQLHNPLRRYPGFTEKNCASSGCAGSVQGLREVLLEPPGCRRSLTSTSGSLQWSLHCIYIRTDVQCTVGSFHVKRTHRALYGTATMPSVAFAVEFETSCMPGFVVEVRSALQGQEKMFSSFFC